MGLLRRALGRLCCDRRHAHPDGHSTNYIVAAKATGVLSVSTATTNWLDTTNYAKVYQVVTWASTITSSDSYRVGGSGVIL